MGRNDRMVKQYGRHRQRVVLADNWSGSDSREAVFSFSSASDSGHSDSSSYIQTRNRSRQISRSVPKSLKKKRGVNKENRYKRKIAGIFCLSEDSIGSEETASVPRKKCRKAKRQALKILNLKHSTNFSEFDEYSLLVEFGTSFDNDENKQKKRPIKSSVETSTPCKESDPKKRSSKDLKDVNVSLIDYVASPLSGSWCGSVPATARPLAGIGCNSVASDGSSAASGILGASEIVPSPVDRSRSIPKLSDVGRPSPLQSEPVRESGSHFKKGKQFLTAPVNRGRSISPVDYLQQSQDLFDSPVSTNSQPVSSKTYSSLQCVVQLQKLRDSFVKIATNSVTYNLPSASKRDDDIADKDDGGAYCSDNLCVAVCDKPDELSDETECYEWSQEEEVEVSDLSDIQECDEDNHSYPLTDDESSSSVHEDNSLSVQESSSSVHEDNSSSVHEDNSLSVQESSLSVHEDNSSSVHEDNSSSVHEDNSLSIQESISSVHEDNSSSVHEDNSSSVHEDNSSSVHEDNSSSVHEDNSSSVHEDNSSSVHEDNSSSALENSSSAQEENSASVREESRYILVDSLDESMGHLSIAEEGSYHTASGDETSVFYSANSTRQDIVSPKRHQHSTTCDRTRHNSPMQEMSLTEMLTPSKRKSDRAPLSPRSKIFSICEQNNFVPFRSCIPNSMMKTIVKIGEGVFGEVFRAKQNGQSVAIKIVPIEGDLEVNDEPQKSFAEILSEVVISRELSSLRQKTRNRTENFCEVKRVSCVQDRYPAQLLKQWDAYDSARKSENDRPDQFDADQLFMVFEFADCGHDLESFQFDNAFQAKSVLQQVCMSLAVAEECLEFEHRDLHVGNVLVRRDDRPLIACRMRDEEIEVQSHGVVVSIIDFTLSRLRKDGCTVFCDLANDDSLFEGSGDYQFDIYRKMKENNNNNWESFNCYSNVLWIHYLCDKILKKKKYTRNSRDDRKQLREIQVFFREVLTFLSAKQVLFESNLLK